MRPFLISALLGLQLASAAGFVGYASDFKATSFCKAYRCSPVKRMVNAFGGGFTSNYRLPALPRVQVQVETQEDGDVTGTSLNVRGIYYTDLNASEQKAIAALIQLSTGKRVNFPLSQCRPSGDPERARPPVLVDDGEGHTYAVRCASLRIKEVTASQKAMGMAPITVTSVSVQPMY